jgi:UV DNA damage endonuclease
MKGLIIMTEMSIQLGLCCINTVLRAQKPPVFASRNVMLKTFKTTPPYEKILQNLRDTLTMMDWNYRNNIFVFRLSSDIFPHKGNPRAPGYTFDFALDLLREIGNKSRELGMRLTFHPGQYNVIGTPRQEIFNNTVLELEYHSDVFDLMGLGIDSVIVIHGGGVYGNKNSTKRRWCQQFKTLSDKVKSRLVLENDERSFSITDCLEISEEIGIPVVFDTHHFECYKINHPEIHFNDPEWYIPDILASWGNIRPKFHISEQGKGRIGHHSDYIETIPDYLLEIPERYSVGIDIMVEAKAKEQAIFRLYRKYPIFNFCTFTT